MAVSGISPASPNTPQLAARSGRSGQPEQSGQSGQTQPNQNGQPGHASVKSPISAQPNLAEKDASRRIEAAGREIQAAEIQKNQTLDRIRDQYEKQASAESDRTTLQMENQKLQGYKQLVDLKRSQQAELSRAAQDGESELSQVREYYQNAIRTAERNAQESLRATEKMTAQQLEYSKKAGEAQLISEQSDQQQQLQRLRESTDKQLQQLSDAFSQQMDKMKANYRESGEDYRSNFDDHLHKINLDMQEQLAKMQHKTAELLRGIQQDTEDKLSAYKTRQEDPFYKLKNIHAQIEDTGDSYVVRATVPKYEQEHISVSFKGNHIVITGNRRNEEALALEPGHTVSSAAYQSFQETFPLAWPVDESRTTKIFDGDTLIVRVPKKNEYAFQSQSVKTPDTITVESPHFPDHISPNNQNVDSAR